jgi:8-oxo-dGTP pyrophosphatase MutT (NUDIX family)
MTSRETRRWVIPKGWPMKGLRPPKVAAREAYEEAGLVGRIIGKRPVGVFHYEKLLPKDRLLCEVWVFLMRVDHQLDDWPEKGQRETGWFDPAEAAELVDEGGLAEIMRQVVVIAAAPKGLRKQQPRKHRSLLQPQPAR